MDFSRLVDLKQLQGLCESFTSLTGAVTAVLDLDGNILISSGWQDICTRFHRIHPESAARCRESDTFLAAQLAEGKTYNTYHCKNGMMDVAVPIIINGQHMANFFTGQFFFEPPDREFFVQQAKEFGFDADEYLAALDRVPVFSEDYIKSLMEFFTRLTKMIAEIGHARQRTEDVLGQLKVSEQRFSLAMEATEDGLWDWDLVTNKMYYSPGYAGMLGYKQDEMPEDVFGLKKLLHPEDTPNVDKLLSDCFAGRESRFSCELRMRHRDGSWRWILSRGSVVQRNSDGRGIRMVGTHTDITERKQTEDELHKSETKLRHMEKMNAIGQLAGGIAHDFNNQLSGILGYADLLCNELDDTRLRRFAEKILSSSHRASDLTSKLLAFARKGQYQSVPVDMHELIAEVVEILSHSISKKILIRQLLSASPSVTKGDPTQLQSVLLNLALNAADAMPEGGVLTFDTGNVQLEREYCMALPYDIEPGQFLRICVSDNGCGIPRENLPHIFEPFYTTKEVGKGTGMGLAAVYGTIKQHQGAVNVYSEVGHGTSVKLFLPLELSRAERISLPDKVVRAVSDKIILVIDDEEIILDLGKDLLAELGYNAVTKSSGVEGIKYYREHESEVDLVILDMVMPEMNGPETYRVLKSINPDVNVLIASGYSINGAAQELLSDGVKGFFQKPFGRAELSRKIAAVLNADSDNEQALRNTTGTA